MVGDPVHFALVFDMRYVRHREIFFPSVLEFEMQGDGVLRNTTAGSLCMLKSCSISASLRLSSLDDQLGRAIPLGTDRLEETFSVLASLARRFFAPSVIIISTSDAYSSSFSSFDI